MNQLIAAIGFGESLYTCKKSERLVCSHWFCTTKNSPMVKLVDGSLENNGFFGLSVYIIVVYSVSVSVSAWPLEWYISVPINIGVSFQVYRYIYLLIYMFIHQNL